MKFLILKHKKGHWSFAKGHRDEGESKIETARRELHEEAGVDDVEFLSTKILLKETYFFLNKKNIRVKKSVEYFIATLKSGSVKVDEKEITNYSWCTQAAAMKLITYNESRQTLIKANKLISKKSLQK